MNNTRVSAHLPSRHQQQTFASSNIGGQDKGAQERVASLRSCEHDRIVLAGHVPVTYLRPMKGEIAAGMIRRSCPLLWELNAWRGHDRDHARHFRHAHMRKILFPKFIPASASWSKVRRKFRLTSIMLDCNSSVESSPKRMVSASLSTPASCYDSLVHTRVADTKPA